MGHFKGLFSVDSNEALAQDLTKLLNREAVPVCESEMELLASELRIHQIELEMQNRELRAATLKLERSRDYYSDLYDFSPIGYCTLDELSRVININLRGASLLGVERGKLLGHGLFHTLQQADRYRLQGHIAQVLQDGNRHSLEVQLTGLKDHRHLRLESERTLSPDGKTLCLSAMIDITVAKDTEDQLRLTANVFEKTISGVMITDANNRIISVNPAFTRTTGYTAEEAIGQPTSLLSSSKQDKAFYQAMWAQIKATGQWSGEIWNRRKNGELYCESLSICSVLDGQGRVINYIGMFVDISKQLEHQQRLEYVANFDPLTGLPNRVLLTDRLLQAMNQALRRKQLLAVIYLDLDGFKEINDQHGHVTGDKLLKVFAQRMGGILRQGDTLARMGGDEFVVIFCDLKDHNACLFGLNRLLEEGNRPMRLDDLEIQITTSLGVTFYPQAEEVDADQLIRQADQAMYQAKQMGKNRYFYFDSVEDQTIRGYNEQLQEIELALARNEFELYYQPKVNMRSGEVIGVEALIRWRHPEKGLLSPAAFLPIIEDHPLAVEVGNWVIGSALQQLQQWHAAGMALSVSVNIGALQLQQDDFIGQLQRQLAAHPGAEPRFLELEVLETSALEDINRVATIMHQCQDLGIKIALDDFGTGYSSLTYLKRLPFHDLKIDQSFIRDMLQDPSDLAIIEGILGLAHSFERQSIAEGVETVEHGKVLLQFGCDHAQGYGIARPMPADQIMAWAKTWRPDPSWVDQPPVGRDYLPFLFAGIEHRNWFTDLDDYVHGRRDDRPELDHTLCRFGKWLHSTGERIMGGNTICLELLTLHQRIHERALALCDERESVDLERKESMFTELQQMRDELLQQLDWCCKAM